MTRFLIIRHRQTSDCHHENEEIKRCLERFKFGTYFVDKTGTKCDNIATEFDNTANKNCNTSFCFIVEDSEYHRLLETVYRELQPKILSVYSMHELVRLHTKALDNSNNTTQTIKCQTTNIETCEKDVETDEKQFAEAENQTEVAEFHFADAEIQTEVDKSDKSTDIDEGLVSNEPKEPSHCEPQQTHITEPQELNISEPLPSPISEQQPSPVSEQPESSSYELQESFNEPQEQPNIIPVKTENPNDSLYETASSPLSYTNNNKCELSSTSSTTSSFETYFDCPVPAKKMRPFNYSSLLYNSVECNRCLMQIDPDNREEISQHIVEEHLKYKRYQCRLCSVKYSLLKECTDHLQVEHPNMLDMNKIFSDNVDEKYVEEVCRVSKRTFPELFKRSKPVNMTDVIVGMTKEAELSVFPEI